MLIPESDRELEVDAMSRCNNELGGLLQPMSAYIQDMQLGQEAGQER
jgi:hypothetical protein